MITLIAAIAKNKIIGAGNTLPWHLPEDLAHFKKATTNGILIVGRRTYDSLPQLPGRQLIVLSNTLPKMTPKVFVARGINHAITACNTYWANKPIFIAGGARIYKQAFPYCNRLLLTHLDDEYMGDVQFPNLNLDAFKIIKHTPILGATIKEYIK